MSVDLPAFVITDEHGRGPYRGGAGAAVFSASARPASSRESSAMRSRIFRRSSSIDDSPAPLPPMPPRWRSRPLPDSRRRGTRYCRRRAPTWALATRERGGRRKGARMTAVRSMTFDARRLLDVVRLRGRDVVIDGATSMGASFGGAGRVVVVSCARPRRRHPRPLAWRRPRELRLSRRRPHSRRHRPRGAPRERLQDGELAAPITVAGCTWARFGVTVATTSRPSVRARRPSFSATDCGNAAASASGRWTATRAACGMVVGHVCGVPSP